MPFFIFTFVYHRATEHTYIDILKVFISFETKWPWIFGAGSGPLQLGVVLVIINVSTFLKIKDVKHFFGFVL